MVADDVIALMEDFASMADHGEGESVMSPPPLAFPPIASADDVHWGFSYMPTGERDDGAINMRIISPRRADGWQAVCMVPAGILHRVVSLEDLVGQWRLVMKAHGAAPPRVGSEGWEQIHSRDDLTQTWAAELDEAAARASGLGRGASGRSSLWRLHLHEALMQLPRGGLVFDLTFLGLLFVLAVYVLLYSVLHATCAMGTPFGLGPFAFSEPPQRVKDVLLLAFFAWLGLYFHCGLGPRIVGR